MKSLRKKEKFEITDDGFMRPSKEEEEEEEDWIKAFVILKGCADHNIRNGILERIN